MYVHTSASDYLHTPQSSGAHEPLATRLTVYQAGLPNTRFIHQILASSWHGDSAMSERLGLSEEAFESLMATHFPGMRLPPPSAVLPVADAQREEERAELLDLLMRNRNESVADSDLMAQIVTDGCLGPDHLWSDLGLRARAELSALITLNFPDLSAKNPNSRMKWKRFFYKQLCEQEGIYVCRSPSCEACQDYAKCFGPDQ
ncbi:nitrogen fixation protein NifQ [Magnetofaba australis]|uniref:Putative NifQ family protein n=1 Tax=Magnetofaba australis IT-1 TaxID=1434232 RepID=A0A1Y2K2P2_9PROT|nr:nitrogen fixation protein NifQ [Magnetofaba australis]OSM02219.1 putative NifQ family protein [Magnetofaba australis IT-1]